jgi:uncharacterized membrane protein
MKQNVFEAGRIGALSDGVFAIAMTLLVLDLKLPELGQGLDFEAFSTALIEQGPRFLSWLISFAILCRLWISQHALLAGAEQRSRSFVGWTFLFLGAVAFIPFPTSLLSEHRDQPLSVVIFSVTLAVAGFALLGMHRDVIRRQPARDGAASGHERPAIVLLATALVAVIMALFMPILGFLVWVIFPFVAIVVERVASSVQDR